MSEVETSNNLAYLNLMAQNNRLGVVDHDVVSVLSDNTEHRHEDLDILHNSSVVVVVGVAMYVVQTILDFQVLAFALMVAVNFSVGISIHLK